MPTKRRCYALLLSVLVASLTLGGCDLESDRTAKPSPDWSRGLYLGRTTIKQPVALQADADGHVHLVWHDEGLRYAHLDDRAQVLVNQPLDIDTPNPRRPQLLVDGEGTLHLAWLSRQGGIEQLYHALVGPQGRASAPFQVSRAGEDVSSFRIYLSPTGAVEFIWSGKPGDGSQGLFHAALANPPLPALLVEKAIDPYVLVDSQDTVHVAWLVERALTARTIYYAILQDTATGPQLVPIDGHRLADFELAEGAVYDGPILGVDTGRLYVLWSEQNLGGGLTPTSAFSRYVTFPLGEPALSSPLVLGLPPETRPRYDDYASPYGLTVLDYLSPSERRYGSDFVNTPATVSTQRSDLPVMVSLVTESEAESQIQLATAVLAAGEPVGYQLASAVTTASLVPAIVADAEHYLHLAWIDTAGLKLYDVYYATNTPDAKAWLDRTTPQDVLLSAANLLFGALSGVALLPIAALWVFPALVWVFAFFIVSGQEEMQRRPTLIGFAVAVLLYAAVKVLLLPGLARAAPFIDVGPSGLATLISVAVPVLILLAALAAVALYTRKAERPTLFVAYAIFAGTDVLLTLFLYGPRFFGAL